MGFGNVCPAQLCHNIKSTRLGNLLAIQLSYHRSHSRLGLVCGLLCSCTRNHPDSFCRSGCSRTPHWNTHQYLRKSHKMHSWYHQTDKKNPRSESECELKYSEREKSEKRKWRRPVEVLTYTGFSILAQFVAVIARAEGPIGGVLTMMRATSIVLLTAVDDLHLNAWEREDQNHNYSA